MRRNREERRREVRAAIYDNAETRKAFFGKSADELMGEVDALIKELTESGELIGAQALADPLNTKTVWVRRSRGRPMLLPDCSSPHDQPPRTALP